ncbi:hypothetical protein [Martelella sp. AD-3]|uniref:hypothetical protein n=1 Tax=Martelella sp. AD-3 TaxID=686597 RepID=UPI000463675F|nr:hypothetical protein [Martelella sp. AD-3]AMM84246.1 hypothetical protein AZF01_07640 [Martelella sp. AD-3]
MATTRKFNTTVKIGGKTYAPGEDVPVSKNGLSEADADNLESVFGKWRKEGDTAVDKRITALTEERDALANRVATLTKERDALASKTDGGEDVADLTEELEAITEERDQLAEDNATLADELKKLQASTTDDTSDEGYSAKDKT